MLRHLFPFTLICFRHTRLFLIPPRLFPSYCLTNLVIPHISSNYTSPFVKLFSSESRHTASFSFSPPHRFSFTLIRFLSDRTFLFHLTYSHPSHLNFVIRVCSSHSISPILTSSHLCLVIPPFIPTSSLPPYKITTTTSSSTVLPANPTTLTWLQLLSPDYPHSAPVLNRFSTISKLPNLTTPSHLILAFPTGYDSDLALYGHVTVCSTL
jgi:hypothetical protein